MSTGATRCSSHSWHGSCGSDSWYGRGWRGGSDGLEGPGVAEYEGHTDNRDIGTVGSEWAVCMGVSGRLYGMSGQVYGVSGRLAIQYLSLCRYHYLWLKHCYVIMVRVAIFSSNLWGNWACYDAHFFYANTWHIDVHLGKKVEIFITYAKIPFFEKKKTNTKAIYSSWFFQKMCFFAKEI